MDEIFDLTGSVALVTGGAAGMGRAIAVRLRQAAANVVVVNKDPDTPTVVARSVPDAAYVVADVSAPHVHREIIEQASEPFGLPSILVNNAGIYPKADVFETTPEFFELVYDTDLSGLALMSSCVSQMLMAQGKPGTIINLASVDAFKPSITAGLASYAATKGAVVALTRHMAVELGPCGISVDAIAPGTILTDGMIRGLGNGDEAQAREATAPLATRSPIGRIGDLDDIAKVAVFLASPATAYVRGQTIVVDGGFTLG